VWEVKQRLRPAGALTSPREFVLMDRAAVGLGSVMLHLRAQLNFHRLFAGMFMDFDAERLAVRQSDLLSEVGLEPAPDVA
jgi:hypothetical protein